MRKGQLKRVVDSYLSGNQGAFSLRKHARFVLYKSIYDLFRLGSVPSHWHAFNSAHLQNLIELWEKEGKKQATLMKYLACLRKFLHYLGHPLIINNHTLGIVRPRVKKKLLTIPDSISRQIADPTARMLFTLQTGFGLTLNEVMWLNSGIHVQPDSLWITRDMASNSQDRLIPIRNEMQQALLQIYLTLCRKDLTLIDTYGYSFLIASYKYHLNQIGLPSLKRYRYLYAKTFYAELTQVLSESVVKRTLMREMGLRSRRTLWGYLNE